MRLYVCITVLLLSFVPEFGVCGQLFRDEADCKSERPSACVRMALRDPGKLGGNYERKIVETKKSVSADENDWYLAATAFYFGNNMLKFKGSAEVLENMCVHKKSYVGCLARYSTLSRPANTEKEHETAKKWLEKADELASKACQAGDGFACYLAAVSGYSSEGGRTRN